MHRSTLIGRALARRVPATPPSSRTPTAKAEPAHGPGLYLICAIELYERLASVMVFSLLVLYLNECRGLDTGLSAKVASYLHMLSYAAGILGGVIADRSLGARRAALSGALLLAVGYGALGSASSTSTRLCVAGVLVVAGHGLFKPNCTALIGAVYSRSDPRRGNAFVWFYYAINIGAMLGPCIGGLVRTSLGWGAAFRVAAASLAASAGLLTVGKRYLLDESATLGLTPQISCPSTSINVTDTPSSTRIGALGLVMAVLAVFGAALS